MQLAEESRILEFGPFRLDPAARVLTRAGSPVNITPKVFDTLLFLVDHRGRVLSKEELMAGIWEGRRVEEANLTQNISVLRRALGEATDGVKYIATFPGRGYQFQVAVQERRLAPVAAKKAHRRVGWTWGAVLAAIVALSGFGWVIAREDSRPEPRRRPLSRLPGAEFQPALSADGTLAAFVWDQEDGEDTAIFVRGQDEDTPRKLSRGAGKNLSPAWSPDGRFVAYLRLTANDLQLLIAPARGGEEREIARLFPNRYGLMCRHLDWSPDGRWLVVDDKEAESQPLGLFLIDIETRNKRRLTLPERDIIGDADPRFSPDGKQIAFVRFTARYQHDLAMVNIAGGAPRMLTDHGRLIGGHDWTHDGRHLLVSSDRDGQFRLYRLPVNGTAAQPLDFTAFSPIQLSLARRAEKLAIAEFQQDLNLWRLDLESSPPKWHRAIASTATEALPQVSPDGRRICFRSDRAGDHQLWVANLDGSGARQLTHGPHRPFAGHWSADGKRILFGSVMGGLVHAISAEGGIPERIPGASGSHPRFLPDGDSIVDWTNTSTRIVNLRSGAAVTYSEAPWDRPHGMQIMEDGDTVYFVPGRTGDSIWRGSLRTGAASKVVDRLLPGCWGSWAAGKRAIYYLGRNVAESGRAWVMRRDLRSGQDAAVAAWEGMIPPMGTSYWSFTPDERWIYVVRGDRSSSDIEVVEPFR